MNRNPIALTILVTFVLAACNGNATVQQERDQLQAQVSSLQGQVSSLEEQVATLQEQLAAFEEREQAVATERSELEEQVAMFQEQLELLREERDTLQQHLDTNVDAQLQLIESELEQARANIEVLERRREALIVRMDVEEEALAEREDPEGLEALEEVEDPDEVEEPDEATELGRLAISVTPAEAQVSVTGPGLDEAVELTGSDTLSNLEPGVYTVTASLEGYETAEATATVQAGETEALEITLTEEAPREPQDANGEEAEPGDGDEETPAEETEEPGGQPQ